MHGLGVEPISGFGMCQELGGVVQPALSTTDPLDLNNPAETTAMNSVSIISSTKKVLPLTVQHSLVWPLRRPQINRIEMPFIYYVQYCIPFMPNVPPGEVPHGPVSWTKTNCFGGLNCPALYTLPPPPSSPAYTPAAFENQLPHHSPNP